MQAHNYDGILSGIVTSTDGGDDNADTNFVDLVLLLTLISRRLLLTIAVKKLSKS
jgi:hypothetical protein